VQPGNIVSTVDFMDGPLHAQLLSNRVDRGKLSYLYNFFTTWQQPYFS
jgi:hypothetical protein